MMRVTRQKYHEMMQAALNLLPISLADRLREVDLVTEIDPVFIGLHRYLDTGREEPFSRYADLAHVTYSFQQRFDKRADRKTTVYLPKQMYDPWPDNNHGVINVLVHELGHVAHEFLNFEPNFEAVTAYAQTDSYEAFAEAFTAHYLPGYLSWDYREYCPEAEGIFSKLEEIL